VQAARRLSGLTARVAPVALLFVAGTANAGGFEIPDNGTQALGRGAAFVAKADDPTAIYHNPAGLARQRGTQLLVNANVFVHSFEFKRAGVFPDDPNNSATPWGGQPYPAVTNQGGPFFEPFLAATTDFGSDRLTVGAGVFGPPSVGNRTFPLGVKSAPAASRYDFVQSNSTILYPTASVAYRVTPWLDLGLSGHLVLGNFDQTSVSYADVGQCPNVEFQPCDSRSRLVAKGTGVAATIGAMARPNENVQLGVSVRTPVSITAAGTLDPQAPASLPVQIQPGAATLSMKLPLEARAGVRYIDVDGNFELYDLELDAVYEGWAAAQGAGPELKVPELGTFKDIDTIVVHAYKNTYGVRAGGAYNIEGGDGLFSVRAGAYFDTSATDFAYTRLDFDTLTKIAGTFGLGYKRGAFQFDVAYAAVASLPRVVGTGQGNIRPINGSKNGRSVDNNDQLLPAVNEGAYRGFTNIISFGVTLTFDSFFGPLRPVRYGNPYEPRYLAPGATMPEPESKPASDEETKPASDSGDKSDADKSADDADKKRSDDDTPVEKKPVEKKPVEKKPVEKKPPPDDEKPPETKKPEEKKPEEKKPEEKKPEEKKKKDWWEDLD
jgi:long-chain fatty acid transport protein